MGTHPWGVNATVYGSVRIRPARTSQFQWAPTLGGECYRKFKRELRKMAKHEFQWAPTLGGECYMYNEGTSDNTVANSFNGHPPLGVNATNPLGAPHGAHTEGFQWAPTLVGECYEEVREALRSAVMFQWAPTLRGECY